MVLCQDAGRRSRGNHRIRFSRHSPFIYGHIRDGHLRDAGYRAPGLGISEFAVLCRCRIIYINRPVSRIRPGDACHPVFTVKFINKFISIAVGICGPPAVIIHADSITGGIGLPDDPALTVIFIDYCHIAHRVGYFGNQVVVMGQALFIHIAIFILYSPAVGVNYLEEPSPVVIVIVHLAAFRVLNYDHPAHFVIIQGTGPSGSISHLPQQSFPVIGHGYRIPVAVGNPVQHPVIIEVIDGIIFGDD